MEGYEVLITAAIFNHEERHRGDDVDSWLSDITMFLLLGPLLIGYFVIDSYIILNFFKNHCSVICEPLH